MPRKSPYRHPVRAYTREGTRVDKYVRGEGKKPTVPRGVIGSRSLKDARWRVTRGGSTVTVSGSDIVAGLSRGVDVLPAEGQSVTVQRV